MPLISVIMSVHRTEFLAEAMDSILTQTFEDFECLVVNDGGNEMQKFLEQYKDPRIIIINNKQRIGLTHSLNLCMDQAKGDLFARHDGDDIALPHRFEKQIPYFKGDVGVVSCWGKNINSEGDAKYIYWVDTITSIPEDIIHRFLTHSNCILSPGSIFKREVFEKIGYFDPKMKIAQDYNYWLRAMPHFRIRVVPEILVKKRWHEHNVWKSSACQKKDWMEYAKERAASQPYVPSYSLTYKKHL